jgi:hypothetical protein
MTNTAGKEQHPTNSKTTRLKAKSQQPKSSKPSNQAGGRSFTTQGAISPEIEAVATAPLERHADEDYCKEISRRAVARAALHLGVESMTSDTLHVLGDVLISYMERVSSSFSV